MTGGLRATWPLQEISTFTGRMGEAIICEQPQETAEGKGPVGRTGAGEAGRAWEGPGNFGQGAGPCEDSGGQAGAEPVPSGRGGSRPHCMPVSGPGPPPTIRIILGRRPQLTGKAPQGARRVE